MDDSILSNGVLIQEDNINVVVRIRPLNDREKKQNAKSILSIDSQDPRKIWIDCKPEPKYYIFDDVIDENIDQASIFDRVGRRQADYCLNGYNSTIFAYGQTGAGKTFTMLGKSDEQRGLQPRVFEHIFRELLKFESARVKCTYLEIYNEQIIDLFSESGCTLLVREDSKKGVYIEGLSEEKVTSAEQAIELLNTGARNRHVSATQMNFESSRSHSLFSLTIETKEKEGVDEDKIKCSKFHFVDLAGSERQNLTGAAGSTLKEASNINKSLTVLGCVINALVEASASSKGRHIPYRDSKLTFILKDSLGGNSKTCIISAVSDASISFQETLSTLKFAQRAKLIKNKAQLNEESCVSDVRVLREEIKQLKMRLTQLRVAEPSVESLFGLEELKERLKQANEECANQEKDYQLQISVLKAESDKFTKLISDMTKQFNSHLVQDISSHLLITSQHYKLSRIIQRSSQVSCQLSQSSSSFSTAFSAIQEEKEDNYSKYDDEKNGLEKKKQIRKESFQRQEQEVEDRLAQDLTIEDQFIREDEDSNSKNNTDDSNSQNSDEDILENRIELANLRQKDVQFVDQLDGLIAKIEQSIQSRRSLAQALSDKGMINQWNTPEKMKACEIGMKSLREEYVHQLSCLQRELRETKSQKRQLEQQINTERLLNECRQRVGITDNNNSNPSCESDLMKKLDVSEAEKQQLKFEIEQLKEQQQQEEKQELLRAEIVEKELMQQNQQMEELLKENNQLKGRIGQLVQEVEDLMTSSVGMLDQTAQWEIDRQQEKEDFQNQIENLNENIKILTTDRDTLENERENLKDQIKQLEKIRKESEQKDQRIQLDLSSQIEKLIKENSRIVLENNGFSQECQKIRIDCEVIQKDRDIAFEQLERLQRENTRILGDWKQITEEKGNLEKQILELKDSMLKENEKRNNDYEKLLDGKQRMDKENEDIIRRLNELVIQKEKNIELEIEKQQELIEVNQVLKDDKEVLIEQYNKINELNKELKQNIEQLNEQYGQQIREINDEKLRISKENDEIKKINGCLEEDNLKMKNENTVLKEQFEDLKNQNISIDEMKEIQFKVELEKMNEEVKKLVLEIEQQVERIRVLILENNDFKLKYEELQGNNEQLKVSLDNVQRIYKELQGQQEEIIVLNGSLEGQVQVQDVEIVGLKEQLDQQLRLNEDTQIQNKEQFEKLQEDQNNREAILNEKIEQVILERNQIQEEYTAVIEKIEKLTLENKDVISERDLMQQERENIQKEKDELLAERDLLEKKIISIVQEKDELMKEMNDIKENMNVKMSERNQVCQEGDQIIEEEDKVEKKDQKQDQDEIMNQRNLAIAERDLVIEEKEEIQKEREQIEDQYKELKKECKQLKKELKKLKKLNDKEKESQELDIEDDVEAVDDLDQEKEEDNEEEDDKVEGEEEVEEKNGDENENDEEQEEDKCCSKKTKSKKNDVQSLSSDELTNLQKKNHKLTKKLTKLEDQMEVQKAESQAEIDQLNEKILKLTSKKSHLREKLNEIKSNHQAELGDIEITVESLTRQNASFKDQLKGFKTKNANLKEQISQLQNEIYSYKYQGQEGENEEGENEEGEELEEGQEEQEYISEQEIEDGDQGEIEGDEENETQNNKSKTQLNSKLIKKQLNNNNILHAQAAIEKLKAQIAKKNENIETMQLKLKETTQSLKQLQGAHRDISAKFQQAQMRIENNKQKNKFIKESEKFVKDCEKKMQEQSLEFQDILFQLETKRTLCNEISLKYNESQDKIQVFEGQILQSNNEILKVKADSMSRIVEVQKSYEQLQSKHKGLEETFNTLLIQYSTLNNQYKALSQQPTNEKIIHRLNAELETKTQKINDLHTYLDKYAANIRKLDEKQEEQVAIMHDQEKRIADLVSLIGEHEYHAGIASEFIDSLKEQYKQQEAILKEATLKEASMQEAQLNKANIAAEDREKMKVLTKKAEKYKKKCREIMTFKDKELEVKSKEQLSLKERLNEANKKMIELKENFEQQKNQFTEQRKNWEGSSEQRKLDLQKECENFKITLDEKQARIEQLEKISSDLSVLVDQHKQAFALNLIGLRDKDRRISQQQKLLDQLLAGLLQIQQKSSLQDDQEMSRVLGHIISVVSAAIEKNTQKAVDSAGQTPSVEDHQENQQQQQQQQQETKQQQLQQYQQLQQQPKETSQQSQQVVSSRPYVSLTTLNQLAQVHSNAVAEQKLKQSIDQSSSQSSCAPQGYTKIQQQQQQQSQSQQLMQKYQQEKENINLINQQFNNNHHIHNQNNSHPLGFKAPINGKSQSVKANNNQELLQQGNIKQLNTQDLTGDLPLRNNIKGNRQQNVASPRYQHILQGTQKNQSMLFPSSIVDLPNQIARSYQLQQQIQTMNNITINSMGAITINTDIQETHQQEIDNYCQVFDVRPMKKIKL